MLKRQQSNNRKRIIQTSQFYRESQIALKTGLIERYWDMDKATQAWLIALVETQETLEQAMAFVDEQENAEK